jgi:hypothetical protein
MTTSIAPQMAPCAAPAGGALERTRFFPRQLVGPDDLTQDQTYFREKLRRHNRMLHGWGVVCGACVRRGADPCEVVIEPGYILGPWGDEIVIDREVTVNLCRQGAGERLGCCGEAPDPWCADPRADCPDGTLYLAVRYAECQARPVRGSAGACGCGCDDETCEYSRIRDGFAVKLLRDLPSTYATPFQQSPLSVVNPCTRGGARSCPPCPSEPWVILADIAVGSDCRVRGVNCFAHRRLVLTFADFFFACRAPRGRLPGLAPLEPGNIGFARAVGMMSGMSELVDVRSALSGEPPRATVTLRRSDGAPVTLPMHFTVRAGETVGDLLAREGDRELYDPADDRTLTLRELYESAGVAEDTRLESALAALAPLDGRTLGTATAEAASRPGSGGASEMLERLLDRRGIDRMAREHGGDAARAAELRATDLAGVSPRSDLGRRLGGRSIADVAAMSREEFLGEVVRLAELPKARRSELERRATAAWDAARRVTDLARKG